MNMKRYTLRCANRETVMMPQGERLKLAAMAAGLSVLLILRDVFAIDPGKFVYFGYVVFFMIWAKYQTLVCMLCFIFPLLCGLPGTYIAPIALGLLYLKSGRNTTGQIGMLIVVAVMEVFASIWYPKTNIPDMVQYISYAGILFFLIHDKSEQHWKKCLQMYLYGVVVLCAVIITTGIMTAPANWLSLFAKGEFRFGKTQLEDEELMRLILNANNLGNYSAVGGCVGLMLVEHSKGKQKVMNVLLTITALSGGFLSISRSWLLVIAICLFLYILGKVRNPKRLLSAVLVFALLAVVGLLMMGDRTEFLEAFLTRMGGDDVFTGNGRWEHFVQYMEAYLSDPRYILFGTGVTQYKAMTGLWGSLHNGTQQILVCCGILGFVVYLTGLLKPIADIRRTGKRKLAYWIPWIGVVLYIQTTQFLNPMMLMMSYAIGVFALKLGEVENETVRRYG